MNSFSFRALGIVAVTAIAVAAVAAIVFWLTAYPTITWWDSSQYSLAASTLGVTGAPGSLFLTLLGWVVTRLPLGSPAHVLNLFAGALAAITVALVYLIAVRLGNMDQSSGEAASPAKRHAFVAGAILGAPALAFGETLWEHAIKFTPYVLTAAFTGMILRTMLAWWEEADGTGAWRLLALLGLLFGLDFSVHRTNALLLPALLAWILLRRPRTLRDPRAWMGGAAGMAPECDSLAELLTVRGRPGVVHLLDGGVYFGRNALIYGRDGQRCSQPVFAGGDYPRRLH